MRYLALILPLFLACAGTLPTTPTVPVGEKRVETVPLPPDPEAEKLADNVPRGDWVEPQEAGSCAPSPACPAKAGILVSEERASRDALFRIRYRELRTNYVSDQKVWGAQRALYEERLKLADQAIQQAQPGWFQRHGFQLGVVGGFLLGSVLTIAIFHIPH
jgi:hypothetical protein